MEKIKTLLIQYQEWSRLSTYVVLIEQYKMQEPNLALDNCKSMIESAIVTILNDLNIVFKTDDAIHKKLKLVINNLDYHTSSVNESSVKSIVNQMTHITQNIGEIRNKSGFISHGIDVHSKKVDEITVDLVINTTETIMCFLINAHSINKLKHHRIRYDDFKKFNEFLDNNLEYISMHDITTPPSTYIYTDVEVYKIHYNEFLSIKSVYLDMFNNNNFSKYDEFEVSEDFIYYLEDSELDLILNYFITNSNSINSQLDNLKKIIIENDLDVNSSLKDEFRTLFYDGG